MVCQASGVKMVSQVRAFQVYQVHRVTQALSTSSDQTTFLFQFHKATSMVTRVSQVSRARWADVVTEAFQVDQVIQVWQAPTVHQACQVLPDHVV